MDIIVRSETEAVVVGGNLSVPAIDTAPALIIRTGTGYTISGSNFGSTQGTGGVTLESLDGNTVVSQTVQSWELSSIQFDAVAGELTIGATDLILRVTTDSGAEATQGDVTLRDPQVTLACVDDSNASVISEAIDWWASTSRGSAPDDNDNDSIDGVGDIVISLPTTTAAPGAAIVMEGKRTTGEYGEIETTVEGSGDILILRDRTGVVVGPNVASPTISSATGTFAPGNTVTINGSNLDTVTGVTLSGEAQSIGTQSASQITFTAVRGGLNYGTKALQVTDGSNTDSVSVSLATVSGWGFIDVAGLPWPEGQYSMLQDASPSAEDGDQIRYQTTTAEGGTVTMNSDGTFEISTSGTHHFEVEVWDASDSTWPDSTTTITVNEAATIDGTLVGPGGTLSGSVESGLSEITVDGALAGPGGTIAASIEAGLPEITINGALMGPGGTVAGSVSVEGALPIIGIDGTLVGPGGIISGSISKSKYTSITEIRLVAEYDVTWDSE